MAYDTYLGIVEKDKGAGVYILKEIDQDFPATPDAWGGAVAEFRRKHPDRKVVATTSIVARYSSGFGSNTKTVGIIIVTDPK